MIKVNGIAGVFLYANDPKQLAEVQNDSRYPGSKELFTWIRDPEGNSIELYQPI